VARFSPDGQTILYSAAWNEDPPEVYSTRADRPGARSLGLKGAQVLAVSSAGDLAVLTDVYAWKAFVDTGTLTILPLSGGAVHEVADHIQFADFSPDGTKLAVIRDLGPRERVEYPVGRPLFEFTGWLSHVRISPSGDQIAFVEHPSINDTFGSLVVMNAAGGTPNVLVKSLSEIVDLAWGPTGNEIWFTASEQNAQRSVYAVTLAGRKRLLLEVPGDVVLMDISRDGHALVLRESRRRELAAVIDSKTRDFSWFDWTVPDDISPDGSAFTFHEAGVGGGKEYAQFVRKIDGSPSVLLGPGDGGTFSPDGKSVLAGSAGSPSQLVLYPIGAGESRKVTQDAFDYFDLAWLPDSNRFVALAAEPGHSTRLYLADLAGTPPKAISAEGFGSYGIPVSPDGRYFVASCLDMKPCLVPVDGSEPRPIPNTNVTDFPIQWTVDGRFLYTYHYRALPTSIDLVDVANGKRKRWNSVAPGDIAGVHGVDLVRMTRDGRVCLYSYVRTFSELYLAQGIP
jgi:Tol biopolymer transport system component